MSVRSSSSTDEQRVATSVKPHQKINAHFDGGEAADAKRTVPRATLALIKTRLQIDHVKDERAAQQHKPKNKALSKELKKEVRALERQAEHEYISGGLGMTEELIKEKRKKQWRVAWAEGLHTMLGSRLVTAGASIGAAEVASAADKIAIHQTTGYMPQSLFSGWLRMVTQVPQILFGGGNPKLPPNLAATGDFKKANKSLVTAMESLLSSQTELAQALEESRLNPSLEKLTQLADSTEKNHLAIETLRKAAQALENQWILLEKECRGKKGSAVVSAVSGLLSVGAYAIDPTGVATVFAHKILYLAGFVLQAPASAFDYMDGSVDFPQKKSALGIDLKSLVKPESRHKPFEDLKDDDIDTTIATKLYDEQPQQVMAIIRTIYQHRFSQLVSKRLQLRKELEKESNQTANNEHASKTPVGKTPFGIHLTGKSSGSQDKARDAKQEKLAQIDAKIEALQTEIVLYEQHQRYQLDPKGVIGRSLSDSMYFCRKGIDAAVSNKIGEFYAQINQRVANNFNPFMSLGMAAIAQDIVAGEVGPGAFKEGLHSIEGSVPHDAAAEGVFIGETVSRDVAALNSAITVMPARYVKVATDRADLAAPDYLAKGKGIDTTRAEPEQIKQAVDLGVISQRKMKKLQKSHELIAQAQQAPEQDASGDTVGPRTLSRAQKKWNKFQQQVETVNKTVEDINKNWLFHPKDDEGEPMLDHKGKPIVIDLRNTSDCAAEYIPLLERAWIPVKGLPRSVWRNITFWKDVVKAKQIGDECKHRMVHGKVVDEELIALMNDAEAFLAQHAQPESDRMSISSVGKPAVAMTIEAMKLHLAGIELELETASASRYGIGKRPVVDTDTTEATIELELRQMVKALEGIDAYTLMELDSDDKIGASEDLSKIARLAHDLRSHGASIAMLRMQDAAAGRQSMAQNSDATRTLLKTGQWVEIAIQRVTALKNALEEDVMTESFPQ